jgi:hypothetical protein
VPELAVSIQAAEVANRRHEVEVETSRVQALISALDASEPVVGGTVTAVEELRSVWSDAQRADAVLVQVIDFLAEAHSDPNAAALRGDAVAASYSSLGDDPAGELRARTDRVTTAHVVGVLSALWSRAQDERDLNPLFESLLAASGIDLVVPRPGEPFDAYQQDFFEYVHGGNAEKISRTMAPGMVYKSERLSKPSVKVFKGD